MNAHRTHQRDNTNNPDNPNQNICALAIAKKFQANIGHRYLHTMPDLIAALRKTRYVVRSRKSSVRGDTIGKIRNQLNSKIGAAFYVIRVDGHVLLLDQDGKTIIDTAPRKRDRRKITHLYAMFFESQVSMFTGEITHIEEHLKKFGL